MIGAIASDDEDEIRRQAFLDASVRTGHEWMYQGASRERYVAWLAYWMERMYGAKEGE